MQGYEIDWSVIIAIGALAVAMWLATLAKDWAGRRGDGDDE